MSIPPLEEPDLLWLRDRAVGSTDLSITIADARVPGLPLVDVNPSFERLTGYTAAEVKGQNCRFLQGAKTDRVATASMAQAIAEVRVSSTVLLNYRKDGTTFWNEVHISPVRDKRGALTHYVGVQNDVTEREQSRLHLELLANVSEILAHGAFADETVRAIARSMVPALADLCTVHLRNPDGGPRWIATFGIDQPLVDLTTALESDRKDGTCSQFRRPEAPDPIQSGQTLHYDHPSPELLERVAIDLRHRAHLVEQGLRSALLAPIMGGGVVFGTLQLLRFRPEPSFARDEIKLVHDIAARVGGLLEQNRLLEQTQTAIAARDQFLSLAAHELRTPVTSIKGYSQLLSRGVEHRSLTSDRLEQALKAIEASVSRLSTLTDDLLGMARLGSRELPLRNQEIHVPSFLASIVERSEPLLDHSIHPASDLPNVSVLGDLTMLEQVMFHLLSNASKYSHSGSPIEVSAAVDGTDVIVSVADHGRGLTSRDQERLFQPFSRSEDEESSDDSGLGLGLYVSKRILERHGGRIWAESTGRNKGASFHVRLPVQQPEHD